MCELPTDMPLVNFQPTKKEIKQKEEKENTEKKQPTSID